MTWKVVFAYKKANVDDSEWLELIQMCHNCHNTFDCVYLDFRNFVFVNSPTTTPLPIGRMFEVKFFL